MQRTYGSALAWRHSFAVLLLACVSTAQQAVAADDGSERDRLAAVVRQLDLLDHLAKQSAVAAPQERVRYHFDYERLGTDLQRVRVGIHDYLTPQRAQPRDPADLLGDYRQQAESQDTP
ncbi:RAQPRD family integrative conjugative element protein [Achromobacter pestifer]|uniref:Raqprd family integrative conjugative element protein n=1 Tax=Achromobacter pestifer TaxID=1353889 RepID=A0A6S6ZH42_9BURK|nr:RAQPRD family integrative conjugative element protein [Achromobacter pestifer]CAB3647867.1 hypothetical protein LMG3431_02606 [Achromobacter pestifer]